MLFQRHPLRRSARGHINEAEESIVALVPVEHGDLAVSRVVEGLYLDSSAAPAVLEIYFSPLKDKKLPENIKCIWLPGGYPEIYAKELAENKAMLACIKLAADSGINISLNFFLVAKEYKNVCYDNHYM